MFKRYVMGAGVAVVVGTLIYVYGQLQYNAGKAAAKEAQYVVMLEDYKTAADDLLKASSVAQTSLMQIGVRHDEFKESYKNLAEFDCYADAERMQHIFKLYTPNFTR
ncbi:hypothetical protein [Oligella sp. HMSC05A10]|uniref:hypothetical protein n=1 Tax=Oligella sp. HMSC05A10 TaxID=1581112 RepID=UPI00114C8D21|nr:hypothetical protein [Oligella sp. HMSC05A10]